MGLKIIIDFEFIHLLLFQFDSLHYLNLFCFYLSVVFHCQPSYFNEFVDNFFTLTFNYGFHCNSVWFSRFRIIFVNCSIMLKMFLITSWLTLCSSLFFDKFWRYQHFCAQIWQELLFFIFTLLYTCAWDLHKIFMV